jgi:hypothetical protein
MTNSFSSKKLFLVISFSVAALIIGPEYSWISSITTTHLANATTQFSITLHRNNQLSPFGNLNTSSNANQFNIPSNVNPFPNLPSPPSSPSTSSLPQSQNQYPYQYPYSYGYPNQPSSSLPATQDPSTSLPQSQNQYPYQYPYSYGYPNQPSSSLPATQDPSTSLPQSQNQYPYPYTNQQQQQQPPTPTNNAAVPPSTSQSPYPYQQQQQQNQSTSSLTNASQYPYLQQQQEQQQPSQSFAGAQPSVSTLIIITHLNSTRASSNNINTATAAVGNYSLVVENAFTNPDGYTYVYHYMKGSHTGVTLSLQPGIFAVYKLTNNNVKNNYPPLSQSTYDITYSDGCRTLKSNTVGTYGYGIINVGETKTCTVTLSSHK